MFSSFEVRSYSVAQADFNLQDSSNPASAIALYAVDQLRHYVEHCCSICCIHINLLRNGYNGGLEMPIILSWVLVAPDNFDFFSGF